MSLFKKSDSKDFDIIIGQDSSITGEIISSGSIRIDGKVSGDIQSKGDVIIGTDSTIDSDIAAHFCEISGKVNGDIHSKSQLRILNSGSLKGNVVVSSLSIEEGGIFQGNCNITPAKKSNSSLNENNTKKDSKIIKDDSKNKESESKK